MGPCCQVCVGGVGGGCACKQLGRQYNNAGVQAKEVHDRPWPDHVCVGGGAVFMCTVGVFGIGMGVRCLEQGSGMGDAWLCCDSAEKQ